MNIAVLISGGVDSAVALRLLKEQRHDLTAFYLKIWLEDELAFLGECPWEEDLAMVRAVCEQAGVPLEVVSLQTEYWDEVVAITLAEVKAGRTPNPDMLCNQRIKFGKFYEKIDASYDKVATGHYAQLEEKGGVFYLKKSPDPIKDQTYFLAHLNQDQLKRALFPIGSYTKTEVRAKARQFNLPNQDRKDSQGICFLGKIKFSAFVKHHLGEREGDFVEVETGEKVGRHKGFWYYTIGQRQGMGLAGGPWYVVNKDTENNRVYISRHYHSEDKTRNTFRVGALNWLSGYAPPLDQPVALGVKVRHGEKTYGAEVTFEGAAGAAGEAVVRLDESDQGLAAGQFAVFYDGEFCLGAGVIVASE